MQIFKTKLFNRWAEDEGLTDQVLAAAVSEMNSGLVDAALGGNVYKKRVAKPGKGKSGSYRTLLAIKLQDKAFFLYGFSKNQRANINCLSQSLRRCLQGTYAAAFALPPLRNWSRLNDWLRNCLATVRLSLRRQSVWVK